LFVVFEEGTLPSPKRNIVVFADAIFTAAVSVDAVVAVVVVFVSLPG
jgi:hypothetical protein